MNPGATALRVPFGVRGACEDLRHFAERAGVRTRLGRLRLLASTPPLWALIVYRFGRALHVEKHGGRLRRVGQAFYAIALEWVQRASKVSLAVSAEIGERVWLGDAGVIIVAPRSRIHAGCRLHGQNTLGIGGRAPARGVPELGPGTQLAPGAVVVGPVVTPPGFVLGANSVLAKSPADGGAWAGSPARPFAGASAALVPAGGIG